MNRTSVLIAAAVLLTARLALADRGGIPFKPGAVIFEPNQRAVIGYNGHEEILLLSADLNVSEPTKVLQVLPLPSEPKVAKADMAMFVKATALINRKLNLGKGAAGGMRGTGSFGGPVPADEPAGEVTFHDKIGSHDITVTHVLHHRGFIDWVEGYLRKAGVDNPRIPEPMKAVVDEYLRDTFEWFVFDVVDLGKEVKTRDAIQYRFATRRLYYPLRITRNEEGETRVRLLVISPELVRRSDPVHVLHEPIRISPQEVHSLGNKDFDELLKGRSCMLRIWEVKGRLSGFKKDILTAPIRRDGSDDVK
jgi:hypothetical protein